MASLGGAASNQCADALKSASHGLRKLPASEFRTVSIIAARPNNELGKGKIFTLEALAKDLWRSNYNRSGFDYQGDPTRIVRFLKPELTKFFSIKLVDQTKMEIPDETSLNAGIEALNERLVRLGYEPIPYRFVRGNKMSAKDFNQRLIEHNEIAYNETIHDFTYHFYFILMPESVWSPARYRYRIFNQFEAFIRNHPELKHELTQRSELETWFKFIHRMFATEFDIITGGLYERVDRSIDGYIDFERKKDWTSYKRTIDIGILQGALSETPNAVIPSSIVPEFYLRLFFVFQNIDPNNLYSKLYNLSSAVQREHLNLIQERSLQTYLPLIKKFTTTFHEQVSLNAFPKYIVEHDFAGKVTGGAADKRDIETIVTERLRQLEQAASLP